MTVRIALFATACLLNVIAANVCVSRDYGKGGTVCVCNSTQCHTFEPIARTSAGIITRFESDKSGKRFEKSVLKFSDKTFDFTANDGKVITIDRNKRYQRIVGFGGAFTDAAASNILAMGSTMSDRIMKDYYTAEGLGYTVGRIPIAGSDFSTRAYTYDDSNTEDLDLKNFKLADEDINYKIPLLKIAKNISSEFKIFASPWSAPAWMKTNNNLIGKGGLKGGAGGPYYKAWANYIVRFLKEYKAKGLDMWGLTVQNEPFDGEMPGFTFNCMGYTAEQERDFISTDLGPALKAANFGVDKLKLMIFDDQRLWINQWIDPILNDTASAQYVSGIAFHWYLNTVSAPEELDKVHQKYPEYFILSTEACEGSNPLTDKDKVSLGNWGRAENYAYDIITDLQHWTSGWIDWNLALDESGGPNWVNNLVDAPIIVNKTGHEYYKQPMYYSLAHFTRVLSPDSQRIGAKDNDSNGLQVLQTVVFERTDNATVLVALNRLNDTIPLTINDPNYGSVKTEVGPHSVQTYIWY